LDERWDQRFKAWNAELAEQGLPVQIAHLSTVATVLFTRPSRYNWMLQFYLRAQGLALSWVGSGRMIFSLNYTDDELAHVRAKFAAACLAMQRDGWWTEAAELSNKQIRRRVLGELLHTRLGFR